MAAVTLSPATSSQCSSSKSGAFSPTNGLMAKPPGSVKAGRKREMKLTCQAASIVADGVPAMERRKLMNLLLLGAVSLPAAGMLVPFTDFSAQPGSGTSGGGTTVTDEFGNDIIASEWLTTHGPGDRTLTHGLKGDPTYLMVENNTTLATYGINAVCTHLGCIVPWNTVEKKFICPCHGSHYNNEGMVIRGPAPGSLELARVDIDNGKVVFVPWAETDFRTGHAPWWS